MSLIERISNVRNTNLMKAFDANPALHLGLGDLAGVNIVPTSWSLF